INVMNTSKREYDFVNSRTAGWRFYRKPEECFIGLILESEGVTYLSHTMISNSTCTGFDNTAVRDPIEVGRSRLVYIFGIDPGGTALALVYSDFIDLTLEIFVRRRGVIAANSTITGLAVGT